MGVDGEQNTSKGSFVENQRIYTGEISRVVDEKNRLNIPSRWRDERFPEFHALADSKQPCLKLVNAEELRRMQRTLDESSKYSLAEKKKFRRLWFSRAKPCPLDKQGRIVIPPELQERFQFSGDVMLIGAYDGIEIWQPADWAQHQGEGDIDVESMAEDLGL